MIIFVRAGSVQLTLKKPSVNNLSGHNMYHRVYFTESLAEKKGYVNSKEKLTFRSRVVSWLVLVPGSVQLTQKKPSVNNLSGHDMYHRVYFTESLAEKRNTCTSTTVKKNLHLDQECCSDLYWSLVLCNSPKKNLVLIIYLGKICITECISQSHWQKNGVRVHQHSKEKLTFRSRVVSWLVLVSDSVQLTY